MSAKTTKKPRASKSRYTVRDLASGYRFDYSKSKPNRFAGHLGRNTVVVPLDPDVAVYFRDPKQLNTFLRAAIKAFKRRRSRRSG